MKSFISIEDLAQLEEAQLISVVSKEFTSVSTDTRKPLSGTLFIALKGDNYDAHNFLDQASQSGASGILIHQWNEKYFNLKTNLTIVLVPDTLIALQQLAKNRRRAWGKPIIAITGSNGKTTTKEFTAQLLSSFKSVHYNQGSFNNHWGLPLTLLGLQPEHDIAICEMGMNHPGEIYSLCQIAEPNIVGITMVGRAHLEGLGSIESVAQAKEEIFSSLKNNSNCLGIFNLDNPWTFKMFQKYSQEGIQCLTFSEINEQANVHFKFKNMDLDYLKFNGHISGVKGEVTVPVFGRQNLTNLMFATCVLIAAQIRPENVWNCLPKCKTIWGRNQKLNHKSGAQFLFDGYNANPDSQKALIENLKSIESDRPLIGIFGEMRELGSDSASLHEELGQLASKVAFKEVLFIGSFENEFKRGFNQASEPQNKKLTTYSEVTTDIKIKLESLLPEKPIIVIKGSRGIHLEKILDYFFTDMGKN